MKIRDRLTGGVAGTGSVRSREKSGDALESVRTPMASDTVQISNRSLEIQRARLAALQAPDIRQELVDEVVGQLGRGEYLVTGADVAPRLIREHLMDAAG